MKLYSIAGITLALGIAGSLNAGVVYDTDIATPPGVVFGTGNVNGGFAVDTEGQIELGLRAKLRQGPVLHPDASEPDTYEVPTGFQPGNPARAAWNYEFSINFGTMSFADAQTSLVVTNIGTGSSFSINPLTYFGDNEPANSTHLAQNSENPIFTGASGFPDQSEYNVNAPATYRFDLIVNALTGGQLAHDTIFVNVGGGVPEPATFAMIGGGLSLLAVLRRRKKQ